MEEVEPGGKGEVSREKFKGGPSGGKTTPNQDTEGSESRGKVAANTDEIQERPPLAQEAILTPTSEEYRPAKKTQCIPEQIDLRVKGPETRERKRTAEYQDCEERPLRAFRNGSALQVQKNGESCRRTKRN